MQRELYWLALAWCGYFILHSLLASNRVKRAAMSRWPKLASHFRWMYNAVSAVALLPIVLFVHALAEPPLWEWTGWTAWIANGFALAAVAGFFWISRYYDMGAFLGLARHDRPPRFAISPLHRFVRHPWYFLGLIIVWTRDITTAWLVSAVAITLYLIVGSRLEEHKLQAEFGARYAEYRRRVPGLIPRPWKYLRESDLEALQRSTN
jgi:protein-S-isoprenylcysteine O-methyltransferase Ste14